MLKVFMGIIDRLFKRHVERSNAPESPRPLVSAKAAFDHMDLVVITDDPDKRVFQIRKILGEEARLQEVNPPREIYTAELSKIRKATNIDRNRSTNRSNRLTAEEECNIHDVIEFEPTGEVQHRHAIITSKRHGQVTMRGFFSGDKLTPPPYLRFKTLSAEEVTALQNTHMEACREFPIGFVFQAKHSSGNLVKDEVYIVKEYAQNGSAVIYAPNKPDTPPFEVSKAMDLRNALGVKYQYNHTPPVDSCADNTPGGSELSL